MPENCTLRTSAQLRARLIQRKGSKELLAEANAGRVNEVGAIVRSCVLRRSNLLRIGKQSYKEAAAVWETEVNLSPAQNPVYIVGPVRRNENSSNCYHR